jgi:uncharacterized protein (DUF2141 family)
MFKQLFVRFALNWLAACALAASVFCWVPDWLTPPRAQAQHANNGALSPGSLVIKVTGFKNDKGELRAVLYDSQKAFDDDRRFKQTTGIISNRTATALFHNVPPGAYAIAVFHDVNKNGELDENWLGMPKENYGLSRNVRASITRIPTFDEIKIDYTGAVATVEIKLQK